jgi:hypothetical protein
MNEWKRSVTKSKGEFTSAQHVSFYGSHLPILSRVIGACSGPILELGMGLYSTPLLDMMCFEDKRPLVSYDNDPVWFKENEKWRSKYHDVYFLDKQNLKTGSEYDMANIEHTFWSVAFLDHKPAIRRKRDAQRLANNALFIILHDSEPALNPYFRYTWIYPLFKYRFDYTKCNPNTAVLSNFINLDFLARP